MKKGFTLIEILVAVPIFLMVSAAIYFGFTNILKVMSLVRVKTLMTNIANEQFEIVRNIPYQNVGIEGGIPIGIISQNQSIQRDGKSFLVNTIVRNIDDPFDGTFNGIPKDLSPADMKLIELTISCTSCENGTPPISFTTKVAPKNLETASTNGALVIRVFDASGFPVSEASVTITNTLTTPSINMTDVTDVSGLLTIVDAPPSVDGYKILVTKDGYSTDQTFPKEAVSNPNPTKPNVTVIIQQITQISLTIDQLSTINVTTLNSQCVATPNFDFAISGDKLIGTNPTVFKYSKTKSTSSGGALTLSDVEWDTYTLSGIDTAHDIIGTNPLLSLGVNPGVQQDLQIITAPKNGKRLLVVVRDQSTGLPISDAEVSLTGPSSYSKSLVTSEGFMTQTDWSGGEGQENFTDNTEYYSSTSGINNSSSGDISLTKILNDYVSSGSLVSSTFDIGAVGNFKQILWSPVNQPAQIDSGSVKVQIATNNDATTWNFKGPDGTSSTYYTISDQNIHSSHNGDRYLRYKLYLSTSNTTYTPTVSDVFFTFTSSCIPPGQVSFSNLNSGLYTLIIEKEGYQSTSKQVTVSEDWAKEEVSISP
jgi:prepilin-type N-terminal cleavage/methylation domain-containing protein